MWKLYKATLAATFAPISQHPYRTASLSIASMAILALCISFLLARGIQGIPIVVTGQPVVLMLSALFVTQVLTLCTLLASAGLIRRSNQDTFSRWLLVLPVSRLQRWLALMVPSFVLAGLALMLTSCPLATIYISMGLHPLLLMLAMVSGAICALGLRHGLPERLTVPVFLLLPAVLGIEYKLLGIALSDTTLSDTVVATVACAVLSGSFIWLFAQSSRHVQGNIMRLHASGTVPLTFLPATAWFLQKLLRSPSLRLNWLVALGMNIAACVVAERYNLDMRVLALCIAITSATCIADIRALTRRSIPAEIVCVRGTAYFAGVQLIGASICTISLAAPLFWATSTLDSTIFSQLAAGLAVGIFAGTLLTPQARDISSQFVSTLLCLGVLVALPMLPFVPTDRTWQTNMQLGIAVLLVGASLWIEYTRNQFTWRKKHHA